MASRASRQEWGKIKSLARTTMKKMTGMKTKMIE